MPEPTLTLDDLRSRRMPRLDPASLPLRRIRQRPGTASFEWMDAAAELVPRPERAPAPSVLALTTVQLGPFSVHYDETGLILRESGSDRWRIDLAHFGGNPALEVEKRQGGVDIELRDAFYPGTLVPASLKARIRDLNGTWTLRLRLEYGGFDATLALSEWLDGMAWSVVHLDLTACPLGPGSALTAEGPGLAAFTPAWLLGTIGSDLLRLPGLGTDVTADLQLVALLPPGAPRILFEQAWRRTAIWLASGDGFPVQPELSEPPPRIHLGAFRFDSLAIEAGLETDDRPWRLLYTQSQEDPVAVGLETGGDLWGSDGEPFRIPMRDPHYLQLFNPDRERTAAGFVAEIADRKTWLHSPGQSLLVRQAPEGGHRSLVLVDLPGQPLLTRCTVGLHKTAPRVEGMLVRPRPAPPRTEMLFVWRPYQQPLGPRSGLVEIEPNTKVATILLPPDTALEVVRRDDFLALDYLWFNRRLRSRGQERRLLPVDSDPSHLAVVFPPQSVGEETFFESDADFPVADSDIPGQGGEFPGGPLARALELESSAGDPDPPPVRALLAKPSRLVFGLEDEFPLDATSLLDWRGLSPSLAPTALPGLVYLIVGSDAPILLPGPDRRRIELAAERRRVSLDRRRLVRRRLPLGNLRRIEPALEHIGVGPDVWLSPAAPSATTTQIEMPFRLILSPNRFGAWAHAMDPVTRGGWTELWHTRLAVRADGQVVEGPHWHRTVRAIWSRDHDHRENPDKPFLMTLDKDDRWQLVHLTADFTEFTPQPVTIDRLMLSALGGWLDSDYRRQPPTTEYSIEQWRHRATQGRDHYARVVYKGFLFPFGHRASLVKISERKVQTKPCGDPVAYLRQRMFIIVREPELTYLEDSPYEFDGREIPLKRVRITTLVTPNLNPPKESPLGVAPGERPLGLSADAPWILAFWPRVGRTDFHFQLKAWDWEDHEIDLLMPLAFVRSDWDAERFKVENPTADQNLRPVHAYNDRTDPSRRRTALGGQQVAFAELTDYDQEGKTTFDTASMSFSALEPADASVEPPCYPEMDEAEVAIAALRQMTGSEEPATIELDPHYKEHAFKSPGNRAGLFARVPSAVNLSYEKGKSADRAGGVATPSLDIRGLSRDFGTVGDTGDGFAGGTFKPADFFPEEARILGGISLSEVLATEVSGADFGTSTPALVTRSTAGETTTTLSWQTTRFNEQHGVFSPLGGARLKLESTFRTAEPGSEADFLLDGTLETFRITLADAVEVDFTAFRFTSVGGKKPDVHVDISDIRFVGPLGFLARIQDKLSPGSFLDPPYLDVTAEGITAGYNLTLPGIAVGVFSLQNLALGARLSLPFTGDPMRLRFNLSERNDPFTVSVGPFGGGGFFALAVGVDGVELLEASLEFGGNISIDLGLASGGISLMAGIYLQLKIATGGSELTGYVRANGELEVLGIVSLSMEFYLGLTYDSGSGKAWGEARVTVEIEVLVFSGSVTVTMRREFAGSSEFLPFGKLMPQPRWAAYARAFA